MKTRRNLFTEPFWRYLMPFFSFLLLLPLLWFPVNEIEQGWSYGTLPLFSLEIETAFSLYLTAAISLFLMAWTGGNLVGTHNLREKTSHLPSAFIIIYGTAAIFTTGYSYTLAGAFLVVAGVSKLLAITREGKSLPAIFSAGLLLTTAACLDSKMGAYTVISFIVLAIYKNVNVKSLLVFLSSVAYTIAVVFALQYLFFTHLDFRGSLNIFGYVDLFKESYFSYLLLISLGVLLSVALFFTSASVSKFSNRIKDKIKILFAVLGLGSILIIAFSPSHWYHAVLTPFLLVISISASNYYECMNTKIVKILFAVLNLAVVACLCSFFIVN